MTKAHVTASQSSCVQGTCDGIAKLTCHPTTSCWHCQHVSLQQACHGSSCLRCKVLGFRICEFSLHHSRSKSQFLHPAANDGRSPR
jgi:hypothetical protein